MALTILVPLDGSATATEVLVAAEAITAMAPTRVILARVVTPADFLISEEQAAAYLDSYAAALHARGVTAATSVLRGSAVPQIIAETRRQAANLIVMVCGDREGGDAWLHRSVTGGVLAATPAPLLVLHPGHTAPPPFGPGLRLIVALDGSPLAAAALPAARELAESLGATIRLVRAISNALILAAPIIAANGRPIQTLEGDAALLHAQAGDYLAMIAEGLGLGPGRVECDVRFGEPTDVLLAVEAECAPALLVMASHGYGGLRQAACGSVAADILRCGRLPVLLVRPPERTGPLTPARIAEEANRENRP